MLSLPDRNEPRLILKFVTVLCQSYTYFETVVLRPATPHDNVSHLLDDQIPLYCHPTPLSIEINTKMMNALDFCAMPDQNTSSVYILFSPTDIRPLETSNAVKKELALSYSLSRNPGTRSIRGTQHTLPILYIRCLNPVLGPLNVKAHLVHQRQDLVVGKLKTSRISYPRR